MKPSESPPHFAKTRIVLAILFGMAATASLLLGTFWGVTIFVMASMGAVGCDRTAALVAEVVREIASTKRHALEVETKRAKRRAPSVTKLPSGNIAPPGDQEAGSNWNGDKAA